MESVIATEQNVIPLIEAVCRMEQQSIEALQHYVDLLADDDGQQHLLSTLVASLKAEHQRVFDAAVSLGGMPERSLGAKANEQ